MEVELEQWLEESGKMWTMGDVDGIFQRYMGALGEEK